MEPVGQFAGEGSGWGLAVIDNCAYLPQRRTPQLPNPGVVLLDVSNPQTPKVVKYLDSPAMMHASESMVIHQGRKLLLAQNWDGDRPLFTEVYDVSDCLNPVLLSSAIVPGVRHHNGAFSSDGMTFYTASCCGPAGFAGPVAGVFAIDVSDPTDLKPVATWVPDDDSWRTHAVAVSPDGTRAYATVGALSAPPGAPHGLVILDTSDVQARRPNPQIRLLGTYFWSETRLIPQFAVPITIQGRPAVLFNDIGGALSGAGASDPVAACRSGDPGWGHIRFIDVQDPRNPVLISKLMLEVHDPANCSNIMYDPVFGFGYAPTRCDVDNWQDPKLMACGFTEGGLRVFDVRDLSKPRELAYYKPQAWWAQPRLASFYPTFLTSGPQTGSAKVHTADAVIFPYFKHKGQEIWFNSFDGGFDVVRFSSALLEREAALFQGFQD